MASASGSIQSPPPGTYYLRSFHGTFVCLRPEGILSSVPARAVGHFERFEVCLATRAEAEALAAFRGGAAAAASSAATFGDGSESSAVALRLGVAQLSERSFANANDPAIAVAQQQAALNLAPVLTPSSEDVADGNGDPSAVTTTGNALSADPSPTSASLGALTEAYVIVGDDGPSSPLAAADPVASPTPTAASLVAAAAVSSPNSPPSPKPQRKQYPLVTIRSVAINEYLCLQPALAAAASDAQPNCPPPPPTVGRSKTATAECLFTLRPHPRLAPPGRFFLLHNEALNTNISAVFTEASKDAHGALNSNASPRPNPNVCGPKAFGALGFASEWCGFELLPVADHYAAAATEHRRREAAEEAAARKQSGGGGGGDSSAESAAVSLPPPAVASSDPRRLAEIAALMPAPLPQGTYTVAACSTNARLAFAPSSGADGGIAFTAVASTNVTAGPNGYTTLRIEAVPPSDPRTEGRPNLYTIGSGVGGGGGGNDGPRFAGLEVTKFLGAERSARLFASRAANAWELWRIEPHPLAPLCFSIYNVAFGRYLMVDPSVSNSNGMVLRGDSKTAGAWEAFYFGPADPVAGSY